MTATIFLSAAENGALGLLALAVLFTLVRFVRGPTLADRIVALDMLTLLGVGLLAALALRLGAALLVDVAVALCVVGFVATLALARFQLTRHEAPAAAATPPPAPEEVP